MSRCGRDYRFTPARRCSALARPPSPRPAGSRAEGDVRLRASRTACRAEDEPCFADCRVVDERLAERACPRRWRCACACLDQREPRRPGRLPNLEIAHDVPDLQRRRAHVASTLRESSEDSVGMLATWPIRPSGRAYLAGAPDAARSSGPSRGRGSAGGLEAALVQRRGPRLRREMSRHAVRVVGVEPDGARRHPRGAPRRALKHRARPASFAQGTIVQLQMPSLSRREARPRFHARLPTRSPSRSEKSPGPVAERSRAPTRPSRRSARRATAASSRYPRCGCDVRPAYVLVGVLTSTNDAPARTPRARFPANGACSRGAHRCDLVG